MKVKQLHQMLEPLTPEVRKRVVHRLAVRQAMLKAGVTTSDLQKISPNQKVPNNSSRAGANYTSIKEALATSIISVGKMLDKGLELKEAIEKGTEEILNKLREIHGTLSSTFEQQVRDGFKKDTEEIFREETEKPMKKIKKISLIIIGIILLFLLMTNPSMKQFKEFDNDTSNRRVSNYLIFSVFENSTDKYLGIAFNFFKIGDSSSKPIPVPYYHSPD